MTVPEPVRLLAVYHHYDLHAKPAESAKWLDCSLASVKRWLRHWRSHGSVLSLAASRKRPRPEAMGGADVALMQLIVDQSPYLFLDEIRD